MSHEGPGMAARVFLRSNAAHRSVDWAVMDSNVYNPWLLPSVYLFYVRNQFSLDPVLFTSLVF